MFDKKQTRLFSVENKTSVTPKKIVESNNPFVSNSMKKSAETTALGNGALKLTTTGSDFVDQFGKISTYKAPRSYNDIAKDMQLLWSQNPLLTLCLLFYIRMITRVVSLFDGVKTESTQRGQGLKNEGIMRMIWVAINYPDTFKKNLPLFISIGSWKDIIQMMSIDAQYNGFDKKLLDWDFLTNTIIAGLSNSNHSELIKKYLPQIKSMGCKDGKVPTLEAQADTMVAKYICSKLFGPKVAGSNKTYMQYRKLKSSGTAHQWQQLISKKLMSSINFDTIHGRALAQLAGGKFLKNNGLEAKYQTWIDSKLIAKYTGYVYELFAPLGTGHSSMALTKVQESTINKQFLGLVETAKNGMTDDATSLIVVIDSSGSMTSTVQGTKSSAYSVAKSMALYFSYLLKGEFENHFLEFSDETIMKTWKGTTPVDKYRNETSAIIAGTNFQSVADHFGKILARGVKESDFPTGILCVSDGCFNSAGTNITNVEALRRRLTSYGFSKEYVANFKIILWDIPNGYYGKKPQTAFEDFSTCPNLIHMSGLDPSAVAFLTGTKGQAKIPTSSQEMFEAAMNQEVLNLLEV